MKICGLNKTTLLDYPGCVAATVFVGGCNFRCPFCHNGDLVLCSSELHGYTETEVLAFLTKRKNVLEGVCITGGEPTLHKELPAFVAKIKALGYKVKLDTNGSNPEMLCNLVEEGLLMSFPEAYLPPDNRYPHLHLIRNLHENTHPISMHGKQVL